MNATDQADDWGILVNECGIFACRQGVDVWLDLWLRVAPERVTTFAITPGGGEHHVSAPTKDDAEFARDYLISKGVPKTFIKVQRLSAAKVSAEKRDARVAAFSEQVRAAFAEKFPELST
jgi:hypothetical protein